MKNQDEIEKLIELKKIDKFSNFRFSFIYNPADCGQMVSNTQELKKIVDVIGINELINCKKMGNIPEYWPPNKSIPLFCVEVDENKNIPIYGKFRNWVSLEMLLILKDICGNK